MGDRWNQPRAKSCYRCGAPLTEADGHTYDHGRYWGWCRDEDACDLRRIARKLKVDAK